MVIKGYRVGPLLKRTASEVIDDNVLGLAAETAYYFFLSLFPLLLFVAPLLGVVGDKERNFTRILDRLQGAVPTEAFGVVRDVVRDVVMTPNAPGLMSVGALLALWTGSSIFTSLMDALDLAYDVPHDPRPWWKKKLIAVGAVLVSGAIMLAATVTLVAGDDIARSVSAALGIGATGRILWQAAQIVLALAVLTLLAGAQFYLLPFVKQTRRAVIPGAILTTTLWLVVTLLFRLYVQHYGSYNKTYGAIGGVIVLLTWMYLSMLCVLIGGEFNSEIHHGTGALRPRQGATYHGRIVTGAPQRSSTGAPERLAASGPE